MDSDRPRATSPSRSARPRSGRSRSAARARLSPGWRSHWRNAYDVARHPLHVALALALVALSIGSGSASLVVALVVMEVIALGALPRSRWVAVRAAAYAREGERARAARERERMRGRMHPDHVPALVDLETRIERARTAGHARSALGPVVDELLDLDRWLGAYVKLSIAYRAASEAAACADAAELSREIQQLFGERERAESPRTGRALATRIRSLAATLSCVRKMEQERADLASELATIAAHCRLAEARATALVGSGDLRPETVGLATELDVRDLAIQELAGIRGPSVRVADEGAAVEVGELREQRRSVVSR